MDEGSIREKIRYSKISSSTQKNQASKMKVLGNGLQEGHRHIMVDVDDQLK